MQRLIVCKACKVFNVRHAPYAHFLSIIHTQKSKARILLLELYYVIVKTLGGGEFPPAPPPVDETLAPGS